MKLLQKSSFHGTYVLTNNAGDKLKLKTWPLLRGALLKCLIIFHKTSQGNLIYLGQYDRLLQSILSHPLACPIHILLFFSLTETAGSSTEPLHLSCQHLHSFVTLSFTIPALKWITTSNHCPFPLLPLFRAAEENPSWRQSYSCWPLWRVASSPPNALVSSLFLQRQLWMFPHFLQYYPNFPEK